MAEEKLFKAYLEEPAQEIKSNDIYVSARNISEAVSKIKELSGNYPDKIERVRKVTWIHG